MPKHYTPSWYKLTRLCDKELSAEKQKQIKKEFGDNWEGVFRNFYNDNTSGGSSRWLVTPDTVIAFIKNLLN